MIQVRKEYLLNPWSSDLFIFIVVTAFFDQDEYTVCEVAGALEKCVVLQGFIDREVTVNFFTVDGTAIGISSCILFLCFRKFHSFNNFYRTCL